MRVLVACEFSGRVREAFRSRGHDAISCDLLDSMLPGPHIQGDVRDVLGGKWDLMIAFPPCTWLTNARNFHRTTDCQERTEALEFVRLLMAAPVRRIAIENPVGILSTRVRKPDQVIHPNLFGDPWYKATCLWLRNLPRLMPTKVVLSNGAWVASGTSKGANNRDPRVRSMTFPGIAEAMAEQWGKLQP